VNQGLVPVVVAVVASAFFYAAPTPPDYQSNEEMANDSVYLDSLAEVAVENIERFKDGEQAENAGEAAVVQSLSVDGLQAAGFVQLQRDSYGFVRPAPKMPGIDESMDGTESDATVSGAALRAIISLFDGSREAMSTRVKDDPDIKFGYISDDDSMLLQ
jgi:hypothetical protein